MPTNSRLRTALIYLAAGVAAGTLLAATTALGVTALRTRNYYGRAVARARRAGYTERRITVREGVTLNIAESPAASHARTPLLLIPGQGSPWQDYARVLPALARNHHVVAVDVHGHGRSTWNRADYSAVTIADDLALLAEQVFDRPYTVAGHSSGGLIGARLAATHPADVRALLLEDVPFFSTLLDRVPHTFAGQDTELLADYLHQSPATREPDYLVHSLPDMYIGTFFGDAWPPICAEVIRQRRADPAATPNVALLGVNINRIWESLSHPHDLLWTYDFFLSRTWHEGFDQAATLRNVTAPTLFLKAPTNHRDGILLAALDEDDLARVESLVPDLTTRRIKSSHDIHLAQPEWYVDQVNSLTGPLA